MWIAVIVAAVAMIVAWQVLATKRILRELQSEAERLSSEIFGAELPPATVEVRFSYGYPSVQVTFPSTEVVASAKSAGLTHLFLEKIQDRCGKSGSKKYPFDASRAVWFTSKDELEEIAKKSGSPHHSGR
jgi:hypothetical protein